MALGGGLANLCASRALPFNFPVIHALHKKTWPLAGLKVYDNTIN
jgi:hypothetical protein